MKAHTIAIITMLWAATAAVAAEEKTDTSRTDFPLERRVERLESLVGPQKAATPRRPDLLTRLSQLEEEVRGHARPSRKPLRQQTHSRLTQLEAQAAKLAATVSAIERRLDHLESPKQPRSKADISRLGRDLSQVERTVRDLGKRLRKIEAVQ